MNSLALLVMVATATTLIVWFALRLTSFIKADGYGFRSSSGLPRDWAPADLPSTPYVAKPHY